MTCKVHFTMSKCSLIIPLKVNNIKKKHWERFLQVGLLEFWVNDFKSGLHLASLKIDLIEHSCFLQYIAGSLSLSLFTELSNPVACSVSRKFFQGSLRYLAF